MPRLLPKPSQRRLLRLGPVGDDGAHLAGGGEQGRGLALDHLEVAVLGGGEVVLRGQLQHLALGDGRRGARQHGQHLERAVLHHELEGAGEQEVADQDRGLVAEHRVGRGEAAAELALVHHVVVQQGGGVDELDAGSEVGVARAGVAAQPGGGERQQRAQPLAAGGDDVRGKLRDERDGAVHARHDRPVADREIALDQGGENVQSVLVAAGGGHRPGRSSPDQVRRAGCARVGCRLAARPKSVSRLAWRERGGTISAGRNQGQADGGAVWTEERRGAGGGDDQRYGPAELPARPAGGCRDRRDGAGCAHQRDRGQHRCHSAAAGGRRLGRGAGAAGAGRGGRG